MKYKRVAQRMREQVGNEPFSKKDIEEAIFVEIGTDPRTVKGAIERMERLKLIEQVKDSMPVEFGVMREPKYQLTQAKDEYF